MSTVEKGILHMRLGENFGTFYTDLVREIAWNECDRNRAIVMLTSVLPGMSVEQAEKIMDGSSKLITVKEGERVKMIEDDWVPPTNVLEKMEKEINESLGMIGHGKYDSGKDESRRGVSRIEILSEEDKFYLHEMARTMLDVKKINLAQAHKIALRIISFVAERLRNEELIREEIEEPILDKIEKDAVKRIENSDIDEETKKRFFRVLHGQSKARKGEVEIINDKKFKYDTGWLDRKGVYFGCEAGQHIYLADLLCERFFPSVIEHQQEHLENKGWVKCTDSRWFFVDCYDKGVLLKLTPKQIETIRGWAQKHGEPLKWNRGKIMVSDIARHRGRGGRFE